jgi:hypothetical protein
MENCKGRNPRAEASIVMAEQVAEQRYAAIVAFVVLVGVTVDLKIADTDMIVDKHAFLAGSALEASAQQQGKILGYAQALLCSPARGGVRNIPVNLNSG